MFNYSAMRTVYQYRSSIIITLSTKDQINKNNFQHRKALTETTQYDSINSI